MAEETVLLRVGIDPDQIESSTKAIIESRKELEKLMESNKELIETEGRASKAYIENEVAIKRLNGTVSSNLRVLEASQKLQKANSDSIVSLRENVKRLNDQYINLSKTQRDSDFGKNLQKQLRAQTDELKKLEGELGNFQRNVGNYKADFNGLAGSIEAGGVPLQSITSKLTAFLNPATAAAGAVAGLGALYISSAAGARDLESAQTQLSTSFTTISNGLAKLVGADGKGGGLLSSLAFEFNKTVFGIGNAVNGLIASNAQNTLKELELVELESKRYAKEQLDLAEEQRRIRDDDTKAFADRLQAAETVSVFVNRRELELVETQNKKLNQLKALLALDGNNLDLKKQIKLVEFEIADIEEDSQGKRTEALNGINALEKERASLLAKQNAELIKQREIDEINKQKKIGEKSKKIIKDFQSQDVNTDSLTDPSASPEVIFEESKNQILLDLQSKYLQTKKDGELASAQFKMQLDKELMQSDIALTQNALGSLGELSSALGANAGVTKAIASAETAISTYQAAQLAFQSQMTGTPDSPIRGAIAAASAIVSGLARLAKINSIQIGGKSKAKAPKANTGTRTFEDGGEVATIGGNLHSAGGTTFQGTDGTTFEAERGEKMFIVNRSSSALLDALTRVNNYGKKGRGAVGRNYFADGGFVSRNSSLSVNGSIEAERLNQNVQAISQMTIVTKVSDIDRVKKDVAFNKAIGGLS